MGEDPDNSYASKFLSEHDFVNMTWFHGCMVSEPTTSYTHILDLIISHKESYLVRDVIVEIETDISHHKLIQFKLNIPREVRRITRFSYRKKDNFIAS